MLNKKAAESRIEQAIKKGDLVLFLADSESYESINAMILKKLVNEGGMKGVYVTLNKPYSVVSEKLRRAGVRTERIMFADGITKSTKGREELSGNCLYFRDSHSLTSLSIIISDIVNMVEGEKFLFLDSLSTLLIYNSAGNVIKFSHFLTTRMREWNLKGILMSLKKDARKELIENIAQFCDSVVRL
jgi:KaiC/GvpD/RAD55 family RecA-like ATPase